jgi:hypothetical protein
MLNPKLEIKQLRQVYLRQKRVRVENFLDPSIAIQVQGLLTENSLPMHMAFYASGRPNSISASEFESFEPAEKRILKLDLEEQASRGIGYCYETVMPKNIKNREVSISGQGHDLLTKVANSFSSQETLKLVKQITGNASVKEADAQLTRFSVGHYITRHRDELPNKRRELAYILSLTDGWHPDWGGLLQFFNPDGSVRDAWVPKFNTLSLFEIQHIHSVTYVTPFARVPRYSMTGWFMS